MKAFLIGCIFIVLVGAGGYFFLKNSRVSQTARTSYRTASITRTGVLQKGSGSDYQHVIIVNGQSWGVTSQSLNLDQYVGKKVEATGQNSGTTLYIDTIKVIQ